MGRNLLTHGQWKQMVGRAGRVGLDTFGESLPKDTGQVNQLLSLSLIAAQATKLGVEVSKLAGAALQGLPCSRAGISPWAGVRQQVFPSTSGSGNEWQGLRVAEVTSDRGYKWQGLRVAKKEIRTTFCQT